MNKAAKITISVIACLLLVSVAVLLVLSQRVTMNPAGTVGNTAGNLNNDGYFCEYDGTVYFYNSFPGGGLFAMNPEENTCTISIPATLPQSPISAMPWESNPFSAAG